jgi:hypothetical protein
MVAALGTRAASVDSPASLAESLTWILLGGASVAALVATFRAAPSTAEQAARSAEHAADVDAIPSGRDAHGARG